MVYNKEKLGQYRHFCKCCRKKPRTFWVKQNILLLGFRDFYHSGFLISKSTCYHSQLPIIYIKVKGEKHIAWWRGINSGPWHFSIRWPSAKQSHLTRGEGVTFPVVPCGRSGLGLRSLHNRLSWRHWRQPELRTLNRVGCSKEPERLSLNSCQLSWRVFFWKGKHGATIDIRWRDSQLHQLWLH